MKKKSNKKKQFNLNEIEEYMSKIELGINPTVEERDTIGEYIDKLKINSQDYE